MSTRIERDSMGEIEVPADRYWGAQTQRSLENFKIGTERLPRPLIRALGLVKQCAAAVNRELGDLPGNVSEAIRDAAQEVIDGAWTSISPRGLADRQRHPEQHERQRGDRQPGGRADGGCARREPQRAPQRSCQSLAVDQRRLSERDPHRGRGGNRRAAAARPGEAARHPGGEDAGVRRHRQDRAHPPPGCDPAHPRPGVLRLRGSAPHQRRRDPRRPAASSWSCRSGAPRSAPG